MTEFTFNKIERLSGKTTIDELFSSSKSFFCYPFKVVFRDMPSTDVDVPPCRVIVNVPKRNHKRAVMRNKLRRRIKEAYRLNKASLYVTLEGRQIHLAILYTSKEDLPFDIINERWQKALVKLEREFQK